MHLVKFLESKLDGVFVVGHSSYLLRLASKLYLCDPVWGNQDIYGGYWTFFPKQIDLDFLLPKIAGVFVSHQHEDHCCKHILERVSCPIYMMKRETNPVVAIEHEEWALNNLHNEINFTWVPAAHNAVDSSLMICSPDFSFYFGNDNFLNKNQLERIHAMGWQFDVAAIPYAFIHYYPFLLTGVDENWRSQEILRVTCDSMRSAQDTQEALRARIAIPCGASLFYKAPASNPINAELASPVSFTDMVPGAKPLIAGSFVLSDGTVMSSFKDEVEYYFSLARALRSFPGLSSQIFESKFIYVPEHLMRSHTARLREKLRGKPLIDYRIYVMCEHSRIGFEIDLDTGAVTDAPVYEHGDSIQFLVNKREFLEWISGNMSFEAVLGSRKFTYSRYPNEYRREVAEIYNAL